VTQLDLLINKYGVISNY